LNSTEKRTCSGHFSRQASTALAVVALYNAEATLASDRIFIRRSQTRSLKILIFTRGKKQVTDRKGWGERPHLSISPAIRLAETGQPGAATSPAGPSAASHLLQVGMQSALYSHQLFEFVHVLQQFFFPLPQQWSHAGEQP
jgi:hypothetical protein